MKKIKLLLLLLLLLTFFSIGNRNLKATDNITYSFTNKDWNATSGDSSANWTSKIAGNSFSNNGIQATTSYKACGNSPISFNNISRVVVSYCTNSSGAGAGKIKVSIVSSSTAGTVEASDNNSQSIVSGNNTPRTLTFDMSPTTGHVQIQANTTTNSIYIISVTITYNATVEKKTVQFKNENGEDFNPTIASIEVNKGANIGTLPTVPDKTGYRFDGWYTDKTAGSKVLPTTAINEDTILYARYIRTYTVSFNTQGGNTIEDSIVDTGAAVSKPTDPTKASYKFLGWYRTGEVETYNFSTPVTADLTLNAKWIRQSIVDFQEMTTSASTMFSYTSALSTSSDTVDFTSTSTGNQTSGNNAVSKTNLNSSLFSVIPYTNSASQVYFGSKSDENDGVFKLYAAANNSNGSSIVFNAIGTNTIITGFKVTIYTGTQVNGKLSVYINDNTTAEITDASYDSTTPANNERTYTNSTGISSFTLKNTASTNTTAQLWLKVSITYKTEIANYTLSSPKLRFGGLIPAAIYSDILTEHPNARFGIEINGVEPINSSQETIVFSQVKVTINEVDYYQFAVVIPVPADMLHEELTAKVFVEILEGDNAGKYYMEEVKYSFVSLAQAYLNSTDPDIIAEIANHLGALNYIATLQKP